MTDLFTWEAEKRAGIAARDRGMARALDTAERKKKRGSIEHNIDVTANQLRLSFHYDMETGDFIRKKRLGRHAAGTVAGYIAPSGYVRISIDKTLYHAHRLAWLYVTGRWPDADIDHKDGNPTNNVWSNLREATRTQNNINGRTRSDNTCGLRGVAPFRNNKFRAYINHSGRHISLGIWPTPEEAALARQRAELSLYGEFAKCNGEVRSTEV